MSDLKVGGSWWLKVDDGQLVKVVEIVMIW